MDNHLKNESLSFWQKPPILVLAVFLLGTLIFLPTLGHDFVWDDHVLTKEDPQIKTPASFFRLLFSDYHISQYSRFYRPLVMMSFALDHGLYKENPGGYHLTNIILHGLNSSLVALLAWLLFQNPHAALLAGALFALHPVHPEAVAWIAGRTDLLLTFFSLLALLALQNRWGRKNKDLGPLFFSPLFFFFALLAKETAVVVLIPMFLWLYQREPGEASKRMRTAFLKITPSVLTLMLYLLLRYWVLNIHLKKPLALSLFSSPFSLFEWFLRYLSFLILPSQRVSYLYNVPRPYPHPYPLEAKFWIMAGLTFFLLAAVIYLMYQKRGTTPFFALLLLPCLPSLYFSIHNDLIMIERYLYLPTAGLALLGTWGFLQVPAKWKKGITGGVVVILIIYLGMNLWRTPLWKNNIVLFEAFKKEYPSAAYVRGALGWAYADKNRLLEAYQELSSAVQLEPRDPRYHSEFGWLCLQLNWPQKAKLAFAEALKWDPNFSSAWEGMGSAYIAEENDALALKYLDLALQADPQNGSAARKKSFVLTRKHSLQK